jgi:hypothetical protein
MKEKIIVPHENCDSDIGLALIRILFCALPSFEAKLVLILRANSRYDLETRYTRSRKRR